MSQGKVAAIVDSYRRDRSQLVSMLQDIQAEFRYLPKDALVELSEELKVPLSQVYAVATFFRAFSLKPRGRHLINVCLGTACHVRGGRKVLEQLERSLKVERGETTPDSRFTLETVNCMGACALGPIVKIGDEYFGEMRADKVDSLLSKYE